MTIYQQELLRKLPHFGCTGQYSDTDEALAFFYDGFKIGWQDKAGYIYGAIDKELTDEMRDAFYAVQDQAKAVREYTDLYETNAGQRRRRKHPQSHPALHGHDRGLKGAHPYGRRE